MKFYPKNIFHPLIIAILFLSLFVCSQAQTKKSKHPRWDWKKHQAETINYAKKYLISNLDPKLPRVSFAKWFQDTVGKTAEVNWEINDCGEQSGTSEDRGRDFPMCVMARTQSAEFVSISVNIQVGVFSRGITGKKPIVRNIFLGDEAGGNGAYLENLRDLPEELNSMKKSLISFDPNSGVFEISGEKPVSFEDFSTMWIETMDYNSKGKYFAVKKNGGIEFGQKDYMMQKIFFNGKRWSFETIMIEGVSYQFEGKFAKLKLDSHGSIEGNNILQGHLIKFVNGKKTAEADLTFSFYFQGC